MEFRVVVSEVSRLSKASVLKTKKHEPAKHAKRHEKEITPYASNSAGAVESIKLSSPIIQNTRFIIQNSNQRSPNAQ